MTARPEIVITSGPSAGRRFAVKDGGVRLGRSSSNDVQIADEELSRNHCLFEPVGETGVRLTDLASANGTILNGALVGSAPVELNVGDVIEVGKTLLRVGGSFESEPTVLTGRVDLGLGDDGAAASAAGPSERRPLFFKVLVGFAVLAAGAAAALFVAGPAQSRAPAAVRAAESEPVLREVVYESVKADLKGIFRYELTLSADGVLSVRIDDIPEEDRHLSKSARLKAESLSEIASFLAFKAVKDLDREYVGPEPEPAALESRTLRLVYSTRARTISVVNTPEPAAFRALRERLETFAKSELGIWAIQYPREKLLQLAAQSVETGDAKWADRDVAHGNLWGAIAAYREALFYLETINPKPASHAVASEGLSRATTELDRRFADQQFAADRELNLSHWAAACEELKILLEMVPERDDERNRSVREKLVSAERQLKKGGK